MKKFLTIFLSLFIFLSCTKEEEAAKKSSKFLSNKEIKELFVGYWKGYDKENNVFYVLLKSDGTAYSSWRNGEKGKWVIMEDKIHIDWSDGWKAWVYKEKDQYTKISFTPSKPLYYSSTKIMPLTPVKKSEIPKEHIKYLQQ